MIYEVALKQLKDQANLKLFLPRLQPPEPGQPQIQVSQTLLWAEKCGSHWLHRDLCSLCRRIMTAPFEDPEQDRPPSSSFSSCTWAAASGETPTIEVGENAGL